jgi:hypothetical protein
MTKSDIDIKDVTVTVLKEIKSHFSNHNTYSTLFLTHAFNIELTTAVYEMYVNSYIDDHGFMHLFNRPLFTLFKVNDKEIKKFQETNTILTSNDNFVYVYCVGRTNNYYLFMYVFECPDTYKTDYDKFLEGKYSEFSIAYKSKFNKKVMLTDTSYTESPIYGSIFKTDDMRSKIEAILSYNSTEIHSPVTLDPSGEFWPAPKDEFEIFNYTKNDTK